MILTVFVNTMAIMPLNFEGSSMKLKGLFLRGIFKVQFKFQINRSISFKMAAINHFRKFQTILLKIDSFKIKEFLSVTHRVPRCIIYRRDG